ncbi:anti-sigma factor [Microbacterium xanthum]|uniref:anti-sigma factor n=1 Tax=Microbacterium xanthum TaxID=3079794 RepID=UPI002AD1F325|nr:MULTISPECIES: anti-sigma factor [unclassified Microbacterium]MDZ8171907.1 anti-sigma factor [Microbacterium sp. KSW-48]MDZ8199996.1 anti-sigma factor [Microbacterium sp. SSW1-59]
MNQNEFAELSAGHVMRALSDEDERAYQAALAANPEWQHVAAEDADTVAVLASAVPAEEPPPAVRDALFARIAQTPQLPATPAAEAAAAPGAPRTEAVQTVARQKWMRGMFALAASLVLLVALGFGAVTVNEFLTRPASIVALQQIEDAPDSQAATAELATGEGTVTAYWSESLGQAVLVSDDLPTLTDEETYELWFVRGEQPISAGLYTPGDEPALLDGELEPGDALAVTVEPAGGSPTGAPSTVPIVVIPTA